MAVNPVVEYGRSGLSKYDYTVDLLSGLTDDELDAIQKIVIVFINKNRDKMIQNVQNTIIPFQPQTEAQLLSRIDKSIAQIDAGMCEDLDDVVNEMLAGL